MVAAFFFVLISLLGCVGMTETPLKEALWGRDPYLEQVESSCNPTTGFPQLACFKFSLLQHLDSWFKKEEIPLNDNLKLIKISTSELIRLSTEPYEFDYTDSGRGSSFWGLNEAFAYLSRRVEKFIKSTGLEVTLDSQVTEAGRYEPRFIDEIYTELDTIDYKHNKPQKESELKKLFIPLLFILKLFKLKLLLFLPLILGVASVKKFLGFLLLAVPALIGYLKFCKPGQNYGSFGHSAFYNHPPLHDYYDRLTYEFPNTQDFMKYRTFRTQEKAFNSYNY